MTPRAGPENSGNADYERGRALLEAGDFATARITRRSIVPLAAATTLNAQIRAPSLLAEALLSVGERLKAHEIATLALSREPNNKRGRSSTKQKLTTTPGGVPVKPFGTIGALSRSAASGSSAALVN